MGTARVVVAIAAAAGLAVAAQPATGAAPEPAPAEPVLQVWFDHPDESLHQHADAFDGTVDVATDQLLDPSPGVLLAGMNPVTPGRLLDTRLGIGAPVGPLVAGTTLRLPVLGQYGVPASGVDAVALNMTATEASSPSFLTVWPTGSPFPRTSSLNMAPGQTVPNLVIAKVGPDGTVSIANGIGSSHVLADVVGWSGSASFLRSMAPERILDTRDGIGVPAGAVGPGGTIDVGVTGAYGVPSTGVDAVIINVTATGATAGSFVTVWPTGTTKPLASSVNMAPGETNPNLVIAKVGANGRVSMFNAAGSTHLIADLVGWIPTGGAYTAVTPTRILDTRSNTGRYGTIVDTQFGPVLRPYSFGGSSSVRANDPLQLDVVTTLGLPASTSAVLLNITGTQATQPTFVTAWGYGVARPEASSLNIVPGTTRPNLVLAEVGVDGFVSLFNANGNIHLIADVVGYFEARNAQDDLDEVVGEQVHVVHVIPSDQPLATFGDAEVRATLEVAEEWLEGLGGRGIRFDTVGGQIEVTTHRIQETTAALLAETDSPGFEWVDWMLADGLATDGKAYIVFVEGPDTGGLCGLGGSGQARVFTNGCLFSAFPGNGNGIRPALGRAWTNSAAARTALHELMHVLGAVASCSPDYGGGGHVSDIRDLMYSTQFFQFDGTIQGNYATVLDPQRDDYWGQGNGLVCPGDTWNDVSLSPFLDAPD